MKEQFDKEQFDKKFNEAFDEKSPDFDTNVNIALVGKVSSGKSSLLNAILGCDRSNPVADVGAHSGVTTRITAYRLDEKVLIIDCPGLDDVRKENSAQTNDFLKNIDLGLFVVTGSADASQKANYEDLKRNTRETLVVLNKRDEWDDLDEAAYDSVVQQWKSTLGVDRIFGTCAKGYDPRARKDAPMDIRGVDELREEIFAFLKKHKKDLLLSRHMKNKKSEAVRIIAGALVAVAAESFIPGSAAYITATQIITIVSLNYLYTGSVLSKSSALSLLPTFIGESIGTTAFLWAQSFLPPTGVINAVAAGIAVAITFAMLAAVKWVLERGYKLEGGDVLGDAFRKYKTAGNGLKSNFSEASRNPKSFFKMLADILG